MEDRKTIIYDLSELKRDKIDNIDNEKLAIAISGGGNRSVCYALGYFRVLNKLGILNKTSCISSISGASFFSAIIEYSDYEIDDLIGINIPIDEMNPYSIESYNFINEKFIGHVMINAPVNDIIRKKISQRVRNSKLWEETCSDIYLKPYGLDKKFPVSSEEEKNIYPELDCVVSRKNFPLSIISACIYEFDKKDSESLTLVEFTSKYTGILKENERFGGLLFSNPGFGCVTTNNFNKVTNVKIHPFRNNYLANAISCSSAAFAVETAKIKNSYFPFSEVLSSITPLANVWKKDSEEMYNGYVVDGGFLDFSGIIPLLTRKCKKILLFIDNDNFNGENYCIFGITGLFGIEKHLKCLYSELRENIKVFKTEDWIEMRKEFEERYKNGKIAYFRKTLEVLRNDYLGVEGGYYVDLLMLPMIKMEGFLEKCNIDLNDPFYSDVVEFPYIGSVFTDGYNVLEMKRKQVNLYSTYAGYCMELLIEDCPDFFE